MGRRAELLNVVEVAAIDDSEHSKQSLEDSHGGLFEILRVRCVCFIDFFQPKGGNNQTAKCTMIKCPP